MNQRISFVFLLLFFAMAWLPLGQQSFMEDHWMKIGAYIAPILLFSAYKARQDQKAPMLTDVVLMSYVFAAAYMVHQVEEHWIDLLGREYPLYDFLNRLVADVAGENKYGVMTRSAIYYINAGMVWTIAFIAIVRSPGHFFPSIAMAGIMLVNGVFHGITP